MTPGFAQVLMKTADGERHWTENADAERGLGSDTAARRPGQLDHRCGATAPATCWPGSSSIASGSITWAAASSERPNDFGVQGEPPTHPELLDYLARELINNGWKLKPIHKLIMTSAVYMQAGNVIPANMKADPQNRLLVAKAGPSSRSRGHPRCHSRRRRHPRSDHVRT